MNLLLRDISTIKSGVFAKPDLNPSVFYIRGTDFDDMGDFKKNSEPTLSMSPELNKHLLNNNDVIFAAKGRQFFATVYQNEYSPAVVSTTFFVIKTNDKLVLSHYLAWFLNHPKTNAVLHLESKGSAMPMIAKSSLDNLEVPVPPLEVQQKIVQLTLLQKKRKQLLNNIESLKTDYINNLTYNTITNSYEQ